MRRDLDGGAGGVSDGYLRAIWSATGSATLPAGIAWLGTGSLPSIFPVTDLAAASVGAAGLAIAELVGQRHGSLPAVAVDRRLTSFWFDTSLRPVGWKLPPARDPVTGDYAAADGWIRLHANAPHHRDAILRVLGCHGGHDEVARAVATWNALDLENAIVEAKGCAAQMRTREAWATHPQGAAVAVEPLLWRTPAPAAEAPAWAGTPARPLRGIRVLDLTRIIAGPVATRFLAGYGAEVLRLDPPAWDEPVAAPELTLGKRCGRIDLRSTEGRRLFRQLLRDADVLVHGYRSDALGALGFDAEQRRRINPGLVDVSLDAYGWTGPWRARRGFDSLVQMSCGIADAGMRELGRDRPTPLPVQALDHTTGYLLATAAIRGLTERARTGCGSEARASLARTAALLVQGVAPADAAPLAPEARDDCTMPSEMTAWGRARRVKSPLAVAGAPMAWDIPAGPLGASPASWRA
ncbi:MULTISPECIES: CoA transferase [unclassified Pigmentiphaga]|uniref:CoA transferase n=1 Tax=unclassified Pigmentiphaga TaxID=2626614 RepID=UPI000B40EB1D|nr:MULTISPECIES: CoA transferase [unclassified Pigmentiphaga]OVZ60961.1 acyl-CoA transferase [Pigmentiphaga sp. NML030171]